MSADPLVASMAPGYPPSLHTKLHRQYALLTACFAYLDCDTNLTLSEYGCAIHRDRRALIAANRETVVSNLEPIERNKLFLGPWPIDLASAEHDTLLRTDRDQALHPARLVPLHHVP